MPNAVGRRKISMTKNISDKKLMFAGWACHDKYYGLYQIFDAPIRKIFRKVITFDPQEVLNWEGQEGMNKSFLETLKREQPDFLLLQVIYEEFYPSTFIEIKKVSPKTKVINFSGDDDLLFYCQSLLLFPFVDYFFITQPDYLSKYKEYGKKAFFIFGADKERFRPINLEKIYDVSFIGTPKADRLKYIRFLLKNGIKIKIYGGGWERYSDLRGIYGGRVSDEDFPKVVNQSKINIVFSKNNDGKTHISDRLPEIMMCKSFSLVEYDRNYHSIFKEGREIITFREKEELLRKIRYYLIHEKECEKIASRAYKRVLKYFSMIKLLKVAFKYIDSGRKITSNPSTLSFSKKVISLNSQDLQLNKKELEGRVKSYDFISFESKESTHLPYKNYFQVYSLEKTGKPICLCDAHVHDSLLGDYLLLSAIYACKKLSNTDFFKVVDINQIMTRREYFLENIHILESLCSKKSFASFKDADMTFVALPLVRINQTPKIGYNKMYNVYFMKFEGVLRCLLHKKIIFKDLYFYKLIFRAITSKRFIFRHLYNTFKRIRHSH